MRKPKTPTYNQRQVEELLAMGGISNSESTQQRDELTQNIPERKTRRYFSGGNLVSIMGGVAVAGILVGAVSGVGYIVSVANATSPKVVSEGGVTSNGHAKILHAYMDDMDTVSLAHAETAVEGVTIAMDQSFAGKDFNSDYVTRKAIIETDVMLDTKQVAVTLDPNTEQLTITASKAALTADVHIKDGSAKTYDSAPSEIKEQLDFWTLVADSIDNRLEDLNIKDIKMADLDIVQEMKTKKLNIEQTLERYADFIILTQVDKECTPLISKAVEGYDEKLKNNLREAVKGKILDVDNYRNEVSIALSKMTLEKTAKLVRNAKIVIKQTNNIKPDQGNIDELNDYTEVGIFSSKKEEASKPMTCGVVESALPALEDKSTSTKTNKDAK
ncbi:MAG: hypothetical protein JWN28_616 [Candidatus Saccharibacteria bacterium]|nr:hypothetical protein [Candidatus Saccharibacteria bacterium]